MLPGYHTVGFICEILIFVKFVRGDEPTTFNWCYAMDMLWHMPMVHKICDISYYKI